MGIVWYHIVAVGLVLRNLVKNLWTIDRKQMSKGDSRLLYYLRLAVHTIAKFDGFQSAALSYQVAVALIPMLAIFFALTSGFGLADQLKELLYAKIPAEPDLIDMIMLAADNIIDASHKGLFGIISVLTFVWSIIWLFIRIELVFNKIWNVTPARSNRSFLKSLGVDIVLLLTVPFVIIIFFAGSVVYSHVLDLLLPSIAGVTDIIKSFLGWLIFATVTVLTFTSMYKFIPATHVRFKYAFTSAIISGLIFSGLQYLYLETQVMVTKLNAFYGTVAAIPLFLIWLNYSWQTILYGAQLSCAFQNVDKIESRI